MHCILFSLLFLLLNEFKLYLSIISLKVKVLTIKLFNYVIFLLKCLYQARIVICALGVSIVSLF